MKYRWLVIVFVLFGFFVQAQELNTTVEINSDAVSQSNKQVFKTLKTAVKEFMDNTQWSTKNVNRSEKIDCNILIIIKTLDVNNFSGSIQVQSSRPVYNSNYSSPVFNFRDEDFDFQYIEFEALTYSENNISSNLVAVLSFYANIIVGIDADSFSLNGGTPNLQKAQNIVNMAQQMNAKGWKQEGNKNNRFAVANEILSGANASYREAIYQYHIHGMDLMADNPLEGKKGVKTALDILSNVHRNRPNALPTRMFFDAKADEIVSIFSAGPEFNKQSVVEVLTKISPLNGGKWNRM
ncbi:DUF4835 family protein [Myroides ceti]|uniref:DUF4835 family protein n=1 Tax=Paenimyroides ceti TaxID=395087 RepID=A0ABT8CPS3_9FLAO|nr:DUF4835 family protein [Paenimyroides ceti]MDN3706502.1 DUF4835 family protein [Paenimyroides ceti]